MTIGMESAKVEQSRLSVWFERGSNIYLRLLAIVFFVFAIYTWLQAVGYWDGPNNRFDTMTRNWKIYTAIMLVIHPVTAVGLWTTLAWGRVVWIMALGFQTVALARYGQQLGNDELFISFHLLTLAIFIVFQISLYFINKER